MEWTMATTGKVFIVLDVVYAPNITRSRRLDINSIEWYEPHESDKDRSLIRLYSGEEFGAKIKVEEIDKVMNKITAALLE